ncbi:MAG: hypothetical protein AAF999_13350 [Pseudomonadota bacterium]
MPQPDSSSCERRYLTVLQVVAINAVATVGILVGVLALGASLMTALVSAWLLGAVATMCIAAMIFVCGERQAIKSTQLTGGAALVPKNIRDPLQLWEADRLMEIDHARAVRGIESLGEEPTVDEGVSERDTPSVREEPTRKRRAG